MLRGVLIACAALLGFASFTPAQAAIPIPCTATHFMKAADLRDARDDVGQKIVLFYNVFGCSDGRWDGYLGIDGKYHKLTPHILSSIPQAPSFWAAAWQNKTKFWVEWLWIVLAAFVVVGTLLSKLAEADAAGRLEPGNNAAVRRR